MTMLSFGNLSMANGLSGKVSLTSSADDLKMELISSFNCLPLIYPNVETTEQSYGVQSEDWLIAAELLDVDKASDSILDNLD